MVSESEAQTLRPGTLINPEHLATVDQSRHAFLSSEFQLATWQDFLARDRALHVAAELARRADFDDVYGLTPEGDANWALTRGRQVNRAEYEAAKPAKHYFRLQSTRSWSWREGQTQLTGNYPLTMAEMAELLAFCRNVSGYALTMIRVHARRFQQHHFVGNHREDRLGRLLSAHLFMSPEHLADGGGGLHFLGHDANESAVPARFNTFALYDVKAHWFHEVTPVTVPQPLHSLHFWFYG